MKDWNPQLDGVAIIGVAARLPGAKNVSEFWQNQRNAVESISHFREDELEIADAASLVKRPEYIRARSILSDPEYFDAAFFGIYPREAEFIDPQQRVFLECCWEALEDAAYNPFAYTGAVSVYGGSSPSTYFLSRLCSNPKFVREYTSAYQVGNYPAMLGSSPDFLATRVSYKLDLRGPAFTMVAGCSTSLLAICQACQGLLTYQADMALAGAVSISFPQKRGYLYQEGGMVSSDGHCRPFDAAASGTVFGSGCAVVLLKRLEDAVKDGDHIYAVVRGFGMNNDGSARVGYTAPSVEGQSRAIVMAQESAGIDANTIGYIEAHGTATPLGDPIELAALSKAFENKTSRRGFCAVGTVKANIGHIDVASGAAGLIHAALSIKNGELTPTLHFQKPNPNFNMQDSPFFVNTKLRPWEVNDGPRRAGVSSFGVGGTNAHVILEQAPEQKASPGKRSSQLLLLSARSENALSASAQRLATHLREHPEINLADAASTLQVGRRHFDNRRMLVSNNPGDAQLALSGNDPKRIFSRKVTSTAPKCCFLFPGQGSQQPNMGRAIYESEPVFRKEVDHCAAILKPYLGRDLRELLYPAQAVTDELRDAVTETILAQPAIFTVEYALAKLWMSWGIKPSYMIGHSVGEFVAACLGGVFSLEDALRLIAVRGRLMQALPHGAMLSVRLSESELRPFLGPDLSLAAVNAPSLCAVSGPMDSIARLEEELNRRDVVHRRLHTSHAFHSSMMDPILEPFVAEVKKSSLHAPAIPYISGVTGDWIASEDAVNPRYWATHFRECVRFSSGISRLRAKEDCLLLEVGPGNVLATLARQHPAASEQIVVSSLTNGTSQLSEADAIQQALGWMWLGGIQPDWQAFHAGERRLRVSLPTYPFERQRFWIETSPSDETGAASPAFSPEQTASPIPAVVAPVSRPAELARKDFMTQPTVTHVPRAPRKVTLRKMLVEIFQDLSGVDLEQADSNATFLELGFDSLFLTQVTQAIQSKFAVKVTFRQLLDQQSTADALAAFLDEKLPAGAFEEAAPSSEPSQPAMPEISANLFVPLPATSSTGAASAIEQLLRDQLHAMNQLFAQQLASLQTLPSAPSSPTSASSAIVAPSPSTSPSAVAQSEATKELKGYTPFKPLQKSVSGELTTTQEKYIKDLVERYTSKTKTSKQKTQEYRGVLADPRVVSGFRAQWKEMVYPIITSRSKGSRLWDLDGNEYIDILNGFGPIMLGHRPDFVEAAIEKQLHEGFEIGPQTLLAGEVAKALCEMTGNERATFCNTGSEAVIAAMRVARTVTARNKIVFFAGDYHGMFDEVLVKGFKKGGQPQAMPVAPGIPREKAANVIVLEYGTSESLEWIRKNAGDLAAVMVEPVQSRHPDLQPVAFLKELRKITENSGSCLIFDEVVTGFRVHPGGCQALFDIRADLATYGKVLAGGMPIGVLAGKAQYMDALDGGMWQFGDDSFPSVGVTFFAGTFVRHPLAMAACAAVLKHLKEQGPALQRKLSERTAGLVLRLNALLEQNQVPTRIEHFASVFYFSFPSDSRFGSLFYYHLREKGIHLLESFPCFLTTEHSDADLDRIFRAFEETIAEMQAGGALPIPADKTPVAVQVPQEVLVKAKAAYEAPVTESQMEIFLSARLSPEANCSYNESFSLVLRGDLNEEALRDSFNALIARHDALRATFNTDGDAQRFIPSLALEIPLVDFSSLSPVQASAEFEALLADDAHTPFDLIAGPLIRARLARFEPKRHALVVTSHHIVCDGWSTNVLLDELSKLYNASVASGSCQLDPTMAFSEYATAQQLHFRGAEGVENETFWTKQFAELPPLLNLPLDRPRPSMKSFAGATYRRRIGAEAYKAIKRAGTQQKCTLFITLLSGFHVLLSRLGGQDDIVVGIPAAGQSLIEDRTLVGHCVNFIPLRGRLGADLSMSQFLDQMRKTLFDAYDHQNYTYGRLVRKLSIPRDPSRLPLIEVQFNLEKVGTNLHFAGLESTIDPNPKAFVNFDLFLNIIEGEDGLSIDLDYNSHLLDESTVARWLDAYESLLFGFVANPSSKISELPLLNETQRRALASHNQTAADFPRNKSAHQLFEEQVSRSPEATALRFEDETLTYAQLNARANRLANHLVKIGVRSGSLVGIFLDRSAEMVVSLLAVWKAGAAYVPLDPAFPRERLAHILQDTSVPVIITQKSLLPEMLETSARLVCVDRDAILIKRESELNLDPAAGSNAVAYNIYTSGSTGKPKGVEVTHRNLVNLLNSMCKKPGLDSSDVLVAVTTISFDIAALEIYLPLITGATLVLASQTVASDGAQLLSLLTRSGATIMQATPVTYRMLLEAGWTGNPKFTALCGGEALPRELANRILECGVPLWNMYGPTETTVWSAVSQVSYDDGPVPVGPPIDNTQFHVLDANLQPLPLGVPGELFIGGEGVARGYFKRPELTSEKFIPDPFGSEPNSRLFRTGDLVRLRQDGGCDFLGRLDSQIKLRGFRIELGEIEAAIASHTAVKAAMVALREDTPNEKRLVAYMIPNPGGIPASGELRAFLLDKLPDYMVPAAFITIPSFPLTPNGKVDRRALPAPDWAKQPRGTSFVEPSTAEEKNMAAIWAEVLRLEKVGVHDNLFELGADSLHVFQIVARANKAGLDVSPRQLLQFRTISAVLAQLANAPASTPSAPTLAPVSRAKYRLLRQTS